jgi:allophanate hydrolase
MDRMARADRPDVWIHRRATHDVVAEARGADTDIDAGAEGSRPLAGWTIAVKDNIDVVGLPTTAGCPAFAYVPEQSAPVVDALEAAGAVVVGKTNMDQFATGLVGTRSPYGVVANALDPEYVAGGSSSGSAVAVALGLVDVALGTDTAGSGRVPAAFNGVVGIKPTHGLLSTRGVVPACPSFDCVSVFSRTVAEGKAALDVMVGYDDADVESRRRPKAPVSPVQVVGLVPKLAAELGPIDADRYLAAADRLHELGLETVDVDFALFERAGQLLYGGAFVAERYASVGAFVDDHLEDCDPTVATIISAAAHVGAHQLVADRRELGRLRREAMTLFDTVDAVMLPTAPFLPRIDEVEADPIGVNTRLGRYTYACNLLDLCAIAVPAGTGEHDLPFGVSFQGAGFTDDAIVSLGSAFLGEPEPEPARLRVMAPTIDPLLELDLVVAGAHLTGQPLNHELVERQGRHVATTTTSASYRLYALDTTPPKPGLVRTRDDGEAIKVEVWRLPAAGFADFVARVPAPLAIGQVELDDGTWHAGFTCTPEPLAGARDITAFGGWEAYLDRDRDAC